MIALQTLGAVDLRKDGKEVSTILAQPKRLALLAFLASARPRGFHSRDTLLALFWPESDDERARNSLRQALHHLRRALGETAIVGRGDREIAVDSSLVGCDAAGFDEAIEAGRAEDALKLYRGDFLPGLFVQDAPGVERWLDDERARRRRDAITAAWRLAEASERTGDAAAAERWGRTAVALDPEDDTADLRLVTLVDRMRADAVAAATPPARAMPSAQAISSAQASQIARTAEGRGPRAEGPPFWRRPWLLAAAVLGVLAAGWLLCTRTGRAAEPTAPTIAVVPAEAGTARQRALLPPSSSPIVFVDGTIVRRSSCATPSARVRARRMFSPARRRRSPSDHPRRASSAKRAG